MTPQFTMKAGFTVATIRDTDTGERIGVIARPPVNQPGMWVVWNAEGTTLYRDQNPPTRSIFSRLFPFPGI